MRWAFGICSESACTCFAEGPVAAALRRVVGQRAHDTPAARVRRPSQRPESQGKFS